MRHKGDQNQEEVFIRSGNVFEDLGFANPQEALAKAELIHEISSIIDQRHLTQAEVSENLGLPQPKVSQLLLGRLSGFSTDRLLRFLTKLNCDVEIRVHRHPRRRSRHRRIGKIAVLVD